MLEHVQVITLHPHLSVQVCARALADLGACIRVEEQPGVDADQMDPVEAQLAAALKAARPADAGTETVQEIFISFGAPATVTGTPWDPRTLRQEHPDAVVVHISPFGLTGPKADQPATDLTLFASSGIAAMLTGQTDTPAQDPPQRAVGEQSAFIGGLAAACAATGALGAKGGALVDVALNEALATLAVTELTRAANLGKARSRQRRGDGNGATVCTLPCSDGHVAISPREERQWQAWLGVMDNPPWRDDPRFASKANREQHWDALYALLCDWSRQHSRAWIAGKAQQARVPSFPLRKPQESLQAGQLEARDFFRHVILDGHTVKLPGRPYRVTPAATGRDGVACDALPATASARLPLGGVRVLDFSWVIAGPTTTRYLAALGADVIKVEAPGAGDPGRGSELHSVLGQGKRAIVLDLKHPDGQGIARKLAARSDVLLENFATGVMERFGLGAAALQQDNPGLSYVSASGMGREGPEANAVAYGTLLQCYSGFAELNGAPGQPPRVGMAWLDPMCGLMLAMLCHAAVASRRHGAPGVRIDFSMIEAMLWTMLEPLLAVQRGDTVEPAGNTKPGVVHDIWPALGNDAWAAIAVASDAQWRAVCGCIAQLATLADLDATGRAAHADQWYAAMAQWCGERRPDEIETVLTAAGVPAAAVVNALELVNDAHLQERGFWSSVGSVNTPGLPWRADLECSAGPAPALGAHTDEILRDVLGMDQCEIDAVRASGAVR